MALLTFVKAASSVFMKARNSLLERVRLSPSRPAYRWKTASRDSMQRSVSVGCWSKKQGRLSVEGSSGLSRGGAGLERPPAVASLEESPMPNLSNCISFCLGPALWCRKDPEDWGVVHGKSLGDMAAPIGGVFWTGKS